MVVEAELRALVNDGLTIREIALVKGIGKTTVRYWLKVHGLATKRGPHGKHLDGTTKKNRMCSCGETDPDKFYGNKTNVCAKCHSAYTTMMGQKKRLEAIEALGGSCIICGYDSCEAALVFHHRDPLDKDPNFQGFRGWSRERIAVEIAKCDLLCVRCHVEVHETWRGRPPRRAA